jgi:hypothetical protein
MTSQAAERARAPHVIELSLSGKLSRDQTRDLIPRFERVFESYGSVRLLVDMTRLRGWTPGILWEDLPAETLHYSHVDRIAVVGDRKWQLAMAAFCRPFSAARVRYFDQGDVESARAWIEGP